MLRLVGVLWLLVQVLGGAVARRDFNSTAFHGAARAAADACPFAAGAPRKFLLNLIITTSDLPPIRQTAQPLLDRLLTLARAAFGDHARRVPVLVVVDAWPDKSPSGVTDWALAHEASLAQHARKASVRLGGAPVVFELAKPHDAFGREVLMRSAGAPACDSRSSAYSHQCASPLSEIMAETADDCASPSTESVRRCVAVENTGSTIPYLWSALRSIKCGFEFLVHLDGDVLVRPGDRGWAARASAVLQNNRHYFAVQLPDRYDPNGAPCDVALSPCPAECPQTEVTVDTRLFRGIELLRKPGASESLCGSAMVANRNADALDEIGPLGSARRRSAEDAHHFSLEAFVLSPHRFVQRWPLAYLGGDLEFALESTSSMQRGALVLPSGYLGAISRVTGKMVDQFFHGTPYHGAPDNAARRRR